VQSTKLLNKKLKTYIATSLDVDSFIACADYNLSIHEHGCSRGGVWSNFLDAHFITTVEAEIEEKG
jgi:hypothetical protein